MPIPMKTLSMMRAVMYPTARDSFCRRRVGNGTTAVPMFATMSISSRSAAR